MRSYAMVITLGDAGAEWMHLDVALLYVARLRILGRMGSLSDPNIWPHIAECEAIARKDRHGRNLADPAISLCDLATLSLGNDKYPDASSSTPARKPRIRTPKHQGDPPTGSDPRAAYPKFAECQDSYRKRQMKDGEHATRGPKGTPLMGKDFCRRDQINSRTHGLACKYDHGSTEMAAIQ